MKNNLKISSEGTKKQKKNGHTKFIVFMVGLIVITIFGLYSPYFNVKIIEVSGLKKVSKQKIINLSGMYYGQNIFKVNKLKALNCIKSGEPYVDTVEIDRKLPNSIFVNVAERTAVAAIKYMGSYIIVDKNGVAVELCSQITGRDIVELKGITLNKFSLGKKISEGEMDKLKVSLSLLDSLQKSEIIQKVEYLDVSRMDNIMMFVDKRLDVKMGSANDLSSEATCKYRIDFLKCIIGKIPANQVGAIDLTADSPVFSQDGKKNF